jgi:hypothetical protein
MRVQAARMLKNPHVDLLAQTALELIDIAMRGRGETDTDDTYEIVIVRTASPRQSPLAMAAGLPSSG